MVGERVHEVTRNHCPRVADAVCRSCVCGWPLRVRGNLLSCVMIAYLLTKLTSFELFSGVARREACLEGRNSGGAGGDRASTPAGTLKSMT